MNFILFVFIFCGLNNLTGILVPIAIGMECWNIGNISKFYFPLFHPEISSGFHSSIIPILDL